MFHFFAHHPEVLLHGIVVRAKEVMDRGHLQRRHVEVGDGLSPPDRVAGAVDDDSGDNRHTPRRRVQGRVHEPPELIDVDRMALPGAAAHRDAVGALIDQPVDLFLHGPEIHVAAPGEWCGRRGDYAPQVVQHVFLL